MEGWKVILLLICMNFMINFGVIASGGVPIGDGIINRFVNVDYSTGNVGLNNNIQSNIPTNPNSGVTILSGVAFLDGLGIVFNLIAIVLNIFTAPVSLFAIPNFNPILALFFIVPIVVLEILAFISVVRGYPI